MSLALRPWGLVGWEGGSVPCLFGDDCLPGEGGGAMGGSSEVRSTISRCPAETVEAVSSVLEKLRPNSGNESFCAFVTPFRHSVTDILASAFGLVSHSRNFR